MAEHWQELYEVPDAPAALYLVCLLLFSLLCWAPLSPYLGSGTCAQLVCQCAGAGGSSKLLG